MSASVRSRVFGLIKEAQGHDLQPGILYIGRQTYQDLRSEVDAHELRLSASGKNDRVFGFRFLQVDINEHLDLSVVLP